MLLRFVTFSIILSLGLASNACASPVAVAVSIPPQRFFIEKVGGGDVSITVLADKGSDPHSYEPTASQMKNIAGAELYFAIGVPFESQWLPRFTELAPSMRVVSLLQNVARITGKPDLALRGDKGARKHIHDHDHNHIHGLETDDPHIWLSPQIMADTVPEIVAALSQLRPEKASAFAVRGQELIESIKLLDAAIAGIFSSIPEEKRIFLSFHQSWAYYARNYGLREAAVELEGREIGPKSMALLVDFATKNSIRVVVADPMTSTSAVTAVARSVKAKVVMATPLEENWPLSMRVFSQSLADAMQPRHDS